MPYVITAPNALKSPALFPPQANTNFDRLNKIINADHKFTNDVDTQQGIHRQVTMLNRTNVPTVLEKGGNGVLYSVSQGGQSALKWFNGTTYQLAPPVQVAGFTNVIVNSVSLATTASSTVYPNPGFSYMAYVYISKQDSNQFLYFGVVNSNTGNNFAVVNINAQANGLVAIYGGTNNRDLKIKNNSASTVICSYVIQIQQLP